MFLLIFPRRPLRRPHFGTPRPQRRAAVGASGIGAEPPAPAAAWRTRRGARGRTEGWGGIRESQRKSRPGPRQRRIKRRCFIFNFIWKSHPETLVNNKYIDSYQEYIKNKDTALSLRPYPKPNERSNRINDNSNSSERAGKGSGKGKDSTGGSESLPGERPGRAGPACKPEPERNKRNNETTAKRNGTVLREENRAPRGFREWEARSWQNGPGGAALCTVSLLILLVCCCCCFIRGRGGRKKGTANRTAPQSTPKGTPAAPEAVPPGEIRAAPRGAEPEAGARREGGYGTPPLDGTVRKPRKRRRTPNRSHRL